MKKYIFFALTMAMMFAACGSEDILGDENNPETNPNLNLHKVPLNVTAISGEEGAAPAKIALMGPRKVAGTASSSGVALEWEGSDAISVLVGDDLIRTELSNPSSFSGTNAKFIGDVSANQDVDANTSLYSYVSSGDVSYSLTDKKISINLTNQDGTLGDAIEHSLLLSEETAYGTGNVTFNYTNKLAILELKIKGVSETGRFDVTFSADGGISGNILVDPTTGDWTAASGSSAYVKATNVLFEAGEITTCYLAVAPNTQAITNAKVRLDMKNSTCFYVHEFSVTSIDAGEIEAGNIYEQRIKNPKVPVGSWLFSDGTWGEANVPATNKTIVGVIYNNEVDDATRAAGYTHGYAVALEDLDLSLSDAWWAGMNLTVDYNGNGRTGMHISGQGSDDDHFGVKTVRQSASDAEKAQVKEDCLTNLNAEPSGYNYSSILTGLDGEWTVHAPKSAWEYCSNSTNPNMTNMHSFMPTAGEFIKMLRALGGMPATAPNETNGQGWASEVEEMKWTTSGLASSVYTKLGQVLVIGSGMTANAPVSGNLTADAQYWTTTQCDNNEVFCLVISPTANSWIFLDAENKPGENKKTRPFIAF